jgi:xanthine dehydrogenase YagS FAD-binding subunit
MKPLTFLEPASLDEAIAELSRGDGARAMAGGSDLLGELKEGVASYDRLVSLAHLDGLRGIEARPAGLRIAALTTLTELEHSDALEGPYRILADAARSVATPEIRNQGTLGGNLCQRPRCLHYRHALIECAKKGGSGCPAAESPYQSYLSIMGGTGCYAVHPSDLAPPLIALDALVQLRGTNGPRELPLASFFEGPEVDVTREHVLELGEVLTGVTVPAPSPGWRGIYSKSRERTAGDFAIASLAMGFELGEGRMHAVRVVLGGIAPTPLRSTAAEATLEGQAPSEDAARAAAEAVLAGATPLEHNGFKLDLLRTLIVRGVERVRATHEG